MTFVLVGLRGSGNVSLRSEHIRNVRDHLQALFPLPRGLRPARELLRKFRSLGLPPLLFPALHGGSTRGGVSQGAPGVVYREASSPPARPRSSEKGGGGEVSLDIRPLRASAPLSLQPLQELGRGRLLGRDGFPLPAPLPRLLLPTHHSMLCDVMSREKFRRTAPLFDPPVFPDLRFEGQGRIVELALGRTALVTVAVVLALAPLTVRCQAVESVGGGHPLDRCPPASGRDLRIAPALGACALALGETGLDPRIDNGLTGTALSLTGTALSLTGTALDVTGCGLLTTTDHGDCVRIPPLAGELAVKRSPSSFL